MGQKHSNNINLQTDDPVITQEELTDLLSTWFLFTSSIRDIASKEELRGLHLRFINHLKYAGSQFIKFLNDEKLETQKLQQEEQKTLQSPKLLPDKLYKDIEPLLLKAYHGNEKVEQIPMELMVKTFFMPSIENSVPRKFRKNYDAVKRMAVYAATKLKENDNEFISRIRKAASHASTPLIPVIDRYWKGKSEIQDREEIVIAVDNALRLQEINSINSPTIHLKNVELKEVPIIQETKRQRR